MWYDILMPHVPLLEPDSAPEDVQAIYADFYRRMCFPAAPNFIKAQGHSSAVVQGTWDLVRNVLVLGEIPRSLKEMLFVAISRERNCRYCEAAHIACCRMLGVEPRLLESLIADVDGMSDHRVRDLLLFGLNCARDPQALTDADFQRLRNHGLGNSEIVELIAMSALAVYANILADAIAVESDQVFEDALLPAVP